MSTNDGQSYSVVFELDQAEGGYVVTVPALPGCASQGETLEEARSNIREAIELYLQMARKHGDPIPRDTSVILETIQLAG